MATLLSVPAGRCLRRSPETNWVDPQPDKGLIEMKLEDDLLHMWWKNRQTQAVEDELIVFPGEATFERVSQDPSRRTHILKFSSSDQKYFFWFQQRSAEGDLRAEFDINALLQDPTYVPGSSPLPDRPSTPRQPAASSSQTHDESWPPTPGAPLLSHPELAPPTTRSTAAQLPQPVNPATPAPGSAGPSGTDGAMQADTPATQEDMARLLVQWAQSGGLSNMSAEDDDARLTDMLSSANITALVTAQPGVIATLTPLLPPGLGLPEGPPPTAEQIVPILTAPQFTDAIASLDNALRSGGLPGGMMVELGLPESAGTGVKAFLDALQALHRAEGGDERMEED